MNRKCVQRMMRLMGLESIAPKPGTSKPHPENQVYPYLLRRLVISTPDQVWATDITYIPMRTGFLYLVAIMDWYSRRVLAWRLSNTLDSTFCVDALEEALSRFGPPTIFNSDQGSQFTAEVFTKRLRERGIAISMDGKGRCIDNMFVERLWRSLKYEEVYLHVYDTVQEARQASAGTSSSTTRNARTRLSGTRLLMRSTANWLTRRHDARAHPQAFHRCIPKLPVSPRTPLIC